MVLTVTGAAEREKQFKGRAGVSGDDMRGSQCTPTLVFVGEMTDKPVISWRIKKNRSVDSITALRKAGDVVGNRGRGLKTAAGFDGYLENQMIKFRCEQQACTVCTESQRAQK